MAYETATGGLNPLRVPQDHALIGNAAEIPINELTPIISVSPLTLATPHRLFDLQMKISAPVTGHMLPIILLSHGHGQSNYLSSLNGYGPLANFWASHGFVVIQPTHLSSKSLSLKLETPGAPLFWRSRVEDMKIIIDRLSDIEKAVPFLRGRLDQDRIAVAGHSMGGHTASMLLGARLTDPEDNGVVNMIEPRIKAGVLLASPGNGGTDLSPHAFEHYPFLREPSFAEMETPALVVFGNQDRLPHLTTREADWNADPYVLSPAPKALLTVFGGLHSLGGVSGYDAVEAKDESPERLAVVQRLTWAYLRSALYPNDQAWENAIAALEGVETLGKVESK